MGYSKPEISTINILCSLRKSVPPTQVDHLSTTAAFVGHKVALVERFDCSQLDRLLSEGISSVIFEFEVLHGPTRLCYKYCQGKYKDLSFSFVHEFGTLFPWCNITSFHLCILRSS